MGYLTGVADWARHAVPAEEAPTYVILFVAFVLGAAEVWRGDAAPLVSLPATVALGTLAFDFALWFLSGEEEA